MKTLLIVYHSQTGNTEQLAQAVYRGACQVPETRTRLVRAFEATLEDLLTCHGVLFGTPENFGYMSGAIKDFFDRTFYPAQSHRLNLPYALFISAGNDGTGAVRQIDRILIGYPMRQVAEPVICAARSLQNISRNVKSWGCCSLPVWPAAFFTFHRITWWRPSPLSESRLT